MNYPAGFGIWLSAHDYTSTKFILAEIARLVTYASADSLLRPIVVAAISEQLVNLDYAASIDALISGSVDVAIVPALENGERTITAPGIRLMSMSQAEAIAKTVPGLKHVVLWRGLIDLSRDPASEVTTAWWGSFQSFEIRNGVLAICGVRNGEEHP